MKITDITFNVLVVAEVTYLGSVIVSKLLISKEEEHK